MSAVLYLEHLTDADLTFLAGASGEARSADDLLHRLRDNPALLDRVLGQPSVFAELFGPGERNALLRASPFLVFAVLVHRAAQDLARTRFVEEWVGPGRRVPVFDVSAVQDFAAAPPRRLFLAELLASYTHVASGSVWIQTARGWRRRRFSELDPLRLVELIELLPDAERPAVYRRLGDLALFLTGVFPDYAGRHLFPPVQRRRLERALGWPELGPPRDAGAQDPPGGVGLLEQIGGRSYRLAWRAAEAEGGIGGALGDVAEGFGLARRVLNFLTDRYMFPFREQWFSISGG